MGVTTPFDKQNLMVILQHTPGVDVQEIRNFMKINSRVGAENTFEITLSDFGYCGAKKGDIVDITSSEMGGIIKKIQHASGKVTLTGVTWRGLLSQHIIPPSVGTLNGDARYILRTLLTQWVGSNGLIKSASGNCGITISGFSGTNKTILQAVSEAFEAVGARLVIFYDGSNAIFDAEPVRDLSDEIELSQDYSARLYSTDSDLKFFNHCVAIGKGIRAEAWRLSDGTITTNSSGAPTGLNCIDTLIEHENEDEIAKLRDDAKKELEKGTTALALEMDISKHSELYLGDIVAAYDEITGISMIAPVTQIELTMQKGEIEINYEVRNNESN